MENGRELVYPKLGHGKAVFDTQEAPRRPETLKNYDFPTFTKNVEKQIKKVTSPNDPETMHAKRFGPNRSQTDVANKKNQSEGFERIIQVPGCDDGTGLGHGKNLVSVVVVVVARLGAVV